MIVYNQLRERWLLALPQLPSGVRQEEQLTKDSVVRSNATTPPEILLEFLSNKQNKKNYKKKSNKKLLPQGFAPRYNTANWRTEKQNHHPLPDTQREKYVFMPLNNNCLTEMEDEERLGVRLPCSCRPSQRREIDVVCATVDARRDQK